MTQWEYQITVHSIAEILAVEKTLPPVEQAPVLFCGGEGQGQCFFDHAPNPYLAALTQILNRKGEAGWELVQTVLRERDMICFWRRQREQE